MTVPVSPPAWAYDNRTVHVRYTPYRRKFAYRVFQVMLDIDRIAEASRNLSLFSHNRPGLFSFYDRDHGQMDGSALRPWAEARFRDAGVDLEGGPIRLLCMPRILGYVFNPISIYFGYHAKTGALEGVVYDVHNTFGERHVYAAATPTAPHMGAKAFHVSPFFDVAGDYRFRLTAPTERFALTIENRVGGVREHLATLAGERRALTDGGLARVFFGMPLMTLKVIAAIHWEALFIWARGARYRRKPVPPSRITTPLAPSVLAAGNLSRSRSLG